MKTIYNYQKQRFSGIQSNYHKLLNVLYNNEPSECQTDDLIKINNTLDILEAQILNFQENISSNNDIEIENITKNNLVIEMFKPIMIAYRILIDYCYRLGWCLTRFDLLGGVLDADLLEDDFFRSGFIRLVKR